MKASLDDLLEHYANGRTTADEAKKAEIDQNAAELRDLAAQYDVDLGDRTQVLAFLFAGEALGRQLEAHRLLSLPVSTAMGSVVTAALTAHVEVTR